MPPPSILTFSLLLLLSPASASPATSDDTATPYEILESYNFPKGILPKGALSYELDRETGKFKGFLNGTCSFSLEGSYKLKYKSTITGTISKNRLTNLTGVSVKVLFLWLSIVEVSRAGDDLDFSVGIASAAFSVDNFFECPQCGCGLDCVNEKKMVDVVKDLASGTVGGACQLLVGHPFDTIKVKLQSQPTPPPGQPPKFAGAIDAVRQTLGAKGLKGLYRGMGPPLCTVACLKAVLFTVRGQTETLLKPEPGKSLKIYQQILSGAAAGVAISFLACPNELMKCRLQAQSALADTGMSVKYRGPLDVAKHVLRSEGGVRGLYKGWVPIMVREVAGNATVFGVYGKTKQLLAGSEDTSGLGRGSLMFAGGLAGASFWATVYPADVVKCAIQVDDYKKPKYKGPIDAFRKILASEGVKGLYRGFGPAMCRSIPANATLFCAYEVTRSSLG